MRDAQRRVTITNMPLMRLRFSGPSTTFTARQLAMGFGEPANVEVEMQASWSWTDGPAYGNREYTVSPFELVTAPRNYTSQMRVGWAAPEWVTAQLGLTWPPTQWIQTPGEGETFLDTPPLDSGNTLMDIAAAALDHRADDIAALNHVVLSIAIENNWDDTDADALHRVNRLLSQVHSQIPTDVVSVKAAAYGLDEQVSDDLIALAAAEMLLHLRQGSVFRTCSHCGAPFVTTARTTERYCRRPAPGEASQTSRTCAFMGPRVGWEERLTPRRTIFRRELHRLTQTVTRHRLNRDLITAWRTQASDILSNETIEDDKLRSELARLAREIGIV